MFGLWSRSYRPPRRDSHDAEEGRTNRSPPSKRTIPTCPSGSRDAAGSRLGTKTGVVSLPGPWTKAALSMKKRDAEPSERRWLPWKPAWRMVQGERVRSGRLSQPFASPVHYEQTDYHQQDHDQEGNYRPGASSSSELRGRNFVQVESPVLGRHENSRRCHAAKDPPLPTADFLWNPCRCRAGGPSIDKSPHHAVLFGDDGGCTHSGTFGWIRQLTCPYSNRIPRSPLKENRAGRSIEVGPTTVGSQDIDNNCRKTGFVTADLRGRREPPSRRDGG